MALPRLLASPALPLGAAGLLVGLCSPARRRRPEPAQCSEPNRKLRVAFIGNSYLYFHDVPRIFQAMCAHNGQEVSVRDCLRGGSSWASLLREGNGMGVKFKTPKALQPDGSYDIGAPTVEALLTESGGWDFAVMNTYSQEAATPSARPNGLAALQQIRPWLDAAGARPVLLVTPAYRDHVKGSEQIGDWKDFAWKQSAGFREYSALLVGAMPPDRQPRTADANRAFALVRGERPELWQELFHTDHFHPSAPGSFLLACLIFCAVFGQAPPLPQEVLAQPGRLYERSRYMLPPPATGRLPTAEEMLYLRGVAVRVACCDELDGVRKVV